MAGPDDARIEYSSNESRLWGAEAGPGSASPQPRLLRITLSSKETQFQEYRDPPKLLRMKTCTKDLVISCRFQDCKVNRSRPKPLTRVRNPSAFESIKTNALLSFLRANPQNALRKLNNVLVLIDRNADGFGNGAKLTLDSLGQRWLRSESVCIPVY